MENRLTAMEADLQSLKEEKEKSSWLMLPSSAVEMTKKATSAEKSEKAENGQVGEFISTLLRRI